MPYKIHNFSKLTSTNDKARKFIKKGIFNAVITAGTQTKGRGRFGRKWHSSHDGLWLSIILKVKKSENAKYFTFIASIAVARAVKKIAKIDAGIKWPNDIVYNGRKLSGILTEGIFGKESYVIIGIGLNLNQSSFPNSIKDIATSLRLVTGRKYPKKYFLNSILEEFENLCKNYTSKGSSSIISEWKRCCVVLNKRVAISSVSGGFSGMAINVNKDCNLLVRLDDGTLKEIEEGDVTIAGFISQ